MNKNKAKVVFFDMDGVLFDVADITETNKKISTSIWKAVFNALGILPEHEKLKQMYINGHFPSYMEWTAEACRVLKSHKLKREVFLGVIHGRIPMVGAKETIRILKDRGFKTALITGTFDALAQRAKTELGIDHVTSHCKLIFDDKGYLTNWKLTPCDFAGKIDYFHKLLNKLNFTPRESVYIGDEINDIPLFKESCLSIAFNYAKPEVKAAADVVVELKDLRDTLQYITKAI